MLKGNYKYDQDKDTCFKCRTDSGKTLEWWQLKLIQEGCRWHKDVYEKPDECF